jgi:hypothetical protein
MAEAGPTPSAELSADLDRIEAAVDAGSTDLTALGFWRDVARVKPDRVLVERHAEQIGRIDTEAFHRAVRLRLPVWAGNAILLVGVGIGVGAAIGARSTSSSTLAGLLLIVAGVVWSVSFHSPTHWAVGRLVGIRFTDYFLGGPPPPRPGLKTDYATYLRADPNSRAWMHASGAIATKLAPFLALAFWPGSGAPWWSAAALLALGVLQIGTDVAFSVKSSDWKKFRRERGVARARAAA